MHTRKTQGKVLAGFVIAGALVLTLPLLSQAQEKSFAGKSQSSLDPHYIESKADLRLKLDVKREISLSPYVDGDFIHVTSGMESSRSEGPSRIKVPSMPRLQTRRKLVPRKSSASDN